MQKKPRSDRLRVDELLVQRGLCADLEEAKRVIWSGAVIVQGELVDQPGAQVKSDAEVRLRRKQRYATRGGEKLEEALSAFAVAVPGRCALDVGAAGGGFTDCLLAHGATRVYAVEIGHGQLAQRLRLDPRVVDLAGRDVMELEAHELDPPPTLAVVDVTFRSLSELLPKVWRLLAADREVLALLKPLHEAKLAAIGPTEDLPRAVFTWLLPRLRASSLPLQGILPCTCSGPGGAREFLLHLRSPGQGQCQLQEQAQAAIAGGASAPRRAPKPKRSGQKRRRRWRRLRPTSA